MILSENGKWLILGLVIAILILISISIGSSIDIISSVDYRLEIWCGILIAIIFVIILAFKKFDHDIIIPDKAIKVYIDIESIGNKDVVNSEQSKNNAVELLHPDKKTNANWVPKNVGEVSLDGEEIK